MEANGITLDGFKTRRPMMTPFSGIYVVSNNNIIVNNNVSLNYFGVSLGYSSSNNTLAGNNVSNNDYGIYVSSNNDITLVGNNISNNNVYGIYVGHSRNTKVFHNNFVNNSMQAYFEAYGEAEAIILDSGYPGGGNYWKDYTGADSMNGVNQDQPGSDGIGDTPYSIRGNIRGGSYDDYVQERYPLMAPYAGQPPTPKITPTPPLTPTPLLKRLNVVTEIFNNNVDAATTAGLERTGRGQAFENGYYYAVEWQGNKYVALNGKIDKLVKLIREDGKMLRKDGTVYIEKKSLTVGETWDVGDGWTLMAQSIDAKASPRLAWLVLSKDGIKKDDKVVAQGNVYTYVEKSIGGESDVPLFVTYVDAVFAGATSDMAQFTYTWVISPEIASITLVPSPTPTPIPALASTPAPNQNTITNSIGMEFVQIPVGEFDMGSPPNESGRNPYDGEPVHRVKISKAFYMGKYEVTQKQWSDVMGSNPSYSNGDNLPVESVSWNDVQEFIRKLNEKEGTNKYRLPSEAEWEYAARAGTTTRYSFGDDESKLGEYAWYYGNSGDKTHEVGQKKPNPWGLYDVHGNVGEWVQDRWNYNYNGAPADGSAWEGGGSLYRVVRGGSWYIYANYLRSADRHADPSFSNGYLGFRLLRIS